MNELTYFVVRRPRHAVTESTACRVWLECCSAQDHQLPDVQLVDFSRKGAKFKLTEPLAPAESFLMRIEQEVNSVDISLQAVVRWQRFIGGGKWRMGCLFEQEVPYTVIGQLFLAGLLATEPA